MDNNNRQEAAQPEVQIPSQVIGGEAVASEGMEGGGWRSEIRQGARQRIVNKMMESMMWLLPYARQEGLQELKDVAVRFEEKTYNEASSRSDYLRKLSLKVLEMEKKSQEGPNSLQSKPMVLNQKRVGAVCPYCFQY